MSKKKSRSGNRVIEEDPSIVENFDPHVFVVLQSLEGHVFFVEKECAYFSQYIKERLRQQQHAIYSEEIPIPVVDLGVEAHTLEKVSNVAHESDAMCVCI